MARVKYRKIPANELVDLQDVDLRVLDLALADMKDKVRRGNLNLAPYDAEALDQLHQQVLLIKLGETEDEE